MRLINNILINKFLRAAFSMFSLTAIILTIVVQYTEANVLNVLIPKFGPEKFVPLNKEGTSSDIKNHYVFVVDISESFKKLKVNNRMLEKCSNVIKELSKKDRINDVDYNTPTKSTDVAKLYILDALLKLEGTSSDSNNFFSVRTIGDHQRRIFPDTPKYIPANIGNTTKLIKFFETTDIFSNNSKGEWTDFIKLIDHLRTLNTEGEQLIVCIISDFSYSIPQIKNDTLFHKKRIKEKLQELSHLSININMVELTNSDAPNDGIYIAEEHFVEEYFGWKRTGHSIIDLTLNNNFLVSDFIYPIEEKDVPLVFNYNYANSITKSEFLLDLPTGSYSLSMPFEPPILELYPKIEIECFESTKAGDERKENKKIRQGQGIFEFDIDKGEYIKLKYNGRIPQEVIPPVIRLVDRNRAKSYLLPIKFEKTVPLPIQICLLTFIVITFLLFLGGIYEVVTEKNEIKS